MLVRLMGTSRFLAALGLLVAVVTAQLPFATIPTISDEVKANAFTGEAASFLRLWEYALKTDGQGPGPVNRINFEAKTILAPETQILAGLVHQDAAHPLYGNTTSLTNLRREFLLDHLVLEPLEPTDSRLDEAGGVAITTFSGKIVNVTKDQGGNLFVNGVPVESASSLKDGTQVYILKKTLFNNDKKTTIAFRRHNNFLAELQGPLGPPLDIPNHTPEPGSILEVRAPAPPPKGVVGPPASPEDILKSVFPPAPPVSASFDATITSADSPGQERVRRQLEFPGLKGLGDFDPVLRSRVGTLTLPRGFKLSPRPEDVYAREHRLARLRASTVRDEAPLDPLTSIDRFATVFRLSGSPDDKGVVATLQREGLTTLLILLETSGLLNFLISGEKGPYILLAPSEAAFSRLSRKELRQLSRGNDLAYHLIPLRGQPAPEVTNDSTFKTLLGHELRFNVYGSSVFVNGAAVSRGDLPFTHGTIQVVETVLEVPLGQVQTVLVGSGHSYSRVNTLLSVTDLIQSGTYTLVAPPDSAITSKGYSWPGLLMNRAQGRDLLARHTFRGAWYSEGLLQKRTLVTLAGTSVTFRRDVDGTISANGIPLRSWNLTATNGVVHLAADVIPESDLGSDPTTISYPFLSHTEAPIFPSFKLKLDSVPGVPSLSGLYETPDSDPFLGFIPSPETISKAPPGKQTNQESSLPYVPSFQEYMESLGFASAPPAENNIYAPNDQTGMEEQSSPELNMHLGSKQSSGASQSLQTVGSDSWQSSNNQAIDTRNSDLITFLGLLDNTYEQHSKDDSHSAIGESMPFHNNASRRPQPPTTTTPQKQGINEDRNDVFKNTTDYTTLHLSQTNGLNFSKTGNEIILTSDNDNKPIDIVQVSDAAFGHPSGPQTTTESPETSPDTSGTKTSTPVLVVPEGSPVWSPTEAATKEEKVQLDVLGLLERLNLTRFLDLVDRAGLKLTLSLDGPWTVFAPSDAAISSIPSSTFQQIVASRRFLRRLVSYHLVPGRFTSGASFRPGVHLPTLHAGHTLRLNYYIEGQLARWVVGGSVITDLDEVALNGVIHVVDRLLYAPYGDLSTTISLAPALTSFANLVNEDPLLLRYLSGLGPYTVFVPSDHGFGNLSLPEDPLARREWVMSHVVEGAWFTAGFSNIWPLISNTNHSLTTILINQDKATVNGVNIIYADITASNGVIHVLESPLFTPT
nr:uncharacterized protein LOC123763205 [Procambarus clarkii]